MSSKLLTLGLDMDQTNAKETPAERKLLVKDENGEPQQDTFNYASVVGMLLYLSGHTRPDLAFSVSQMFDSCSIRSIHMKLQPNELAATFLEPRTKE